MNLTSPRNPILLAAVIVALIGATALVAGYVERPGQTSRVTADKGACCGCPLAGTEACCQEQCQGECSDDCCVACAGPGCGLAAAPVGCRMKAKNNCDPIGGCPMQ